MPMKVSRTIEDRYLTQLNCANTIKEKLSDVIYAWCKQRGWHFEDRIKQLESYAQKIEQSRIKVVDDVYATTIIVKNKNEIIDCCNQLEVSTNPLGIRFIRRQPSSFTETTNEPDRFNFDSVRMYFNPPLADIGNPPYVDEIFEIQVKTLLEHAWDKATHATFYKSTEELSWAKSRLISQIKALLETAELALIETDLLSKSNTLQKKNRRIDNINAISAIYKELWAQDALPKDIKRLSENTFSFLDYIGQNTTWLESLLKEEKDAGRGPNLENLSPYWVAVQASIRKLTWGQFMVKINDKKSKSRKFEKLPLIKELEIEELNNITETDPVYILK